MKTIVNPFSGGLITVPNSSADLGTKKHTRSATPPSSPIVGDTWEELDNIGNLVMEWFWNGTYWLSKQQIPAQINYGLYSSNINVFSSHVLRRDFNIFIERLLSGWFAGSPNDANNYWTITYKSCAVQQAGIDIGSINTSSVSAGPNRASVIVNLHRNISALNHDTFYVELSKTGTPTSIYSANSLVYRWARP